MPNQFDRDPTRTKKPEGYETWGTRLEVKTRLGIRSDRKLDQLLAQTGTDGLTFFRGQRQVPIEQTKGATGLISPELETRLRALALEEQEERSTADWLSRAELLNFIGCGEATLHDLLNDHPPKNVSEAQDMRTKERGQFTLHYNIHYAEGLKEMWDSGADNYPVQREKGARRIAMPDESTVMEAPISAEDREKLLQRIADGIESIQILFKKNLTLTPDLTELRRRARSAEGLLNHYKTDLSGPLTIAESIRQGIEDQLSEIDDILTDFRELE